MNDIRNLADRAFSVDKISRKMRVLEVLAHKLVIIKICFFSSYELMRATADFLVLVCHS